MFYAISSILFVQSTDEPVYTEEDGEREEKEPIASIGPLCIQGNEPVMRRSEAMNERERLLAYVEQYVTGEMETEAFASGYLRYMREEVDEEAFVLRDRLLFQALENVLERYAPHDEELVLGAYTSEAEVKSRVRTIFGKLNDAVVWSDVAMEERTSDRLADETIDTQEMTNAVCFACSSKYACGPEQFSVNFYFDGDGSIGAEVDYAERRDIRAGAFLLKYDRFELDEPKLLHAVRWYLEEELGLARDAVDIELQFTVADGFFTNVYRR